MNHVNPLISRLEPVDRRLRARLSLAVQDAQLERARREGEQPACQMREGAQEQRPSVGRQSRGADAADAWCSSRRRRRKAPTEQRHGHEASVHRLVRDVPRDRVREDGVLSARRAEAERRAADEERPVDAKPAARRELIIS